MTPEEIINNEQDGSVCITAANIPSLGLNSRNFKIKIK